VVRSILAPQLEQFMILFWSTSAEAWIDEWTETNSLPSRVKVEMALTRKDGGDVQLKDIHKREVAIHSISITKANQNPDLPAAARGSGRGSSGRGSSGRGSSGRGSSSRDSGKSRYTPEQIAAWRKKQAEQNKGKTDGKSGYTDAQKEAYRKRMAELYKRSQSTNQGSRGASPIPNPGLTVSQQNKASNASSASSGTPGATTINDALMDYEGLNGQSATSVQQLLDQGYLSSIPDPPEGTQWVINNQGNVALIVL